MTWADVWSRLIAVGDSDISVIISLSEHHLQLLNATLDLIDNDWSIRKAANNSMCSKSSLHRFIHADLPYLSIELYDSAINVLRKHRRKK